MALTTTDITERTAATCPSYSTGAATCPSYTERTAASSPDYTAGAITAPDYTERTALTNPFLGTDTGTGTGTGTDTTGPVISNIRALAISDTWVKFAWETDEPGTCYAGIHTEILGVVTLVGSHTHYVIGERSVLVTGAKTSTTYYVTIRSTDIYGNGSLDRGKTFKTAQAGGVGGEPMLDV